MSKAVFAGLIFDENDQPVEVSKVGADEYYVVNDAGFHRHIPSETVDRQILEHMKAMISGNEELLAQQTAKMLGKDDIFTIGIIKNQLSQLEKTFDYILEVGFPEETRAYMGMTGFSVKINLHGDVLEVNQPGLVSGDEED